MPSRYNMSSTHQYDTQGPFIRADDLTKRFSLGSGDVLAVRNVRLTVRKGEFLCIIGPSGSGKSTLLYMLGCLMMPTEGALYYNQQDITRFSALERARFRRRHIGFIFQSFHLLHYLNAIQNVELPLMYQRLPGKLRLKRAKDALENVGLASRMHHMPTQMSGGEQQRVAIARALVSEPEIVCADEITGNLDTNTGRDIITMLQTLNKDKGITIVLVTHDHTIAALSDRKIHLQDGVVVGEDSP
ncbi:MAG: ABC transporter ATP-binding protein [Chlamydiota bacterium]|nr:ABC transporter ATP-binding protein [Chlamydiota bacterium]